MTDNEKSPYSNASFRLSNEELAALNRYIHAMAANHASAGEDTAPGSVRIEFEFDVLGRSVTVFFNGAVNGKVIADDSGLLL